MLPGRTYKPEDIVRIARQRLWWVLVPMALAGAVAAVVARVVLPIEYESNAVIQVKPAQIPGNYVASTVTVSIQERLAAVNQSVLSRTNLGALIVQYDLYPELRDHYVMTDVIAMMRQKIRTSTPRGDTFTVSYTHSDPSIARQVNSELATLFINRSQEERSDRAQNTLQFFQDQLDDVQRQLEERDAALANYRTQNANELPSQQQANLTMLSNLRTQLQNTTESLEADREQRLYLQRRLADLEAQPPVTAPAAVAAVSPNAAPATAAAALELAKAELAALLASGKGEQHPDVQTAQEKVRDLTQKAEAEALAMPLTVTSTAGLPPEEVQRLAEIDRVRQDLAQRNMLISRKEAEIDRLQEQAQIYQRRVNNTPRHEVELAKLTRDYDEINRRYTDLFSLRENARVSATFESEGDNFTLVDEASFPERPVSPNKPVITAMGLGAGGAVGLALIALFEYRDRSFKTDADMVQLLSLPVLAVVPFMQSDVDRRRARRRRWLGHLTFGSTVVVCMAVVATTFLF